MTALMLVGGTVFFYLVERNNHGYLALGALPDWQQPFAAFFQSATPRTAGFNSIDQFSMRSGSKFVTIVLMFIGAAPGGTGGGIKVTTFGVLLFAILSELRMANGVVMIRRRISMETVSRALTITGLALALVIGATMVLTFTEEARLLSTKLAEVQAPDTRLSFIVWCRPNHTSPKPPSPSFFSRTQRVLGTSWPTAGRQPNTGSSSALTCRCAFSEVLGATSSLCPDSANSHTSTGSSIPLSR